MTTRTTQPPDARARFHEGVRAGLPFMLMVAPFGLLFGTVAADAGLDLVEIMAFSVLVIAGASQFAALQLLVDQAPVAIAVLTGLAVNLRMAMYSASLMPHFVGVSLRLRAFAAYVMVDQVFALSVQRFAQTPMTASERTTFYFGVATPIIPVWYLGTWFGAEVGGQIPSGVALDFAVPITFIAMVAPMLRTPPSIVAALVAVATSLLAADLPFNLGVILGGLAGTLAGAVSEVMWEQRA
ncbi:MAG TPA: AzlC family ABC transporter permease [Pseudomonadales bacterium]|nr:AzlC family ABC transporter permease [Pseudomonadales bacterium]